MQEQPAFTRDPQQIFDMGQLWFITMKMKFAKTDAGEYGHARRDFAACRSSGHRVFDGRTGGLAHTLVPTASSTFRTHRDCAAHAAAVHAVVGKKLE